MTSIIKTDDGSNTLYSNTFNDQYHSTFGALQESLFIYIQTGLNYCEQNSLKIFEVGFGTGLNAILTFIEGFKKNINIEYHTIELFPINIETINQLNYFEFISNDQKLVYKKLHNCKWNKKIKISENFTFQKIKYDFNNYIFNEKYDLIYFDAFAPDKQPSMWSDKNFAKLYDTLNNKGILTTYSSKGIVKNNLRKAGFKVTRLDGPKGKRHILRAQKL
ncbi:MAG: tRNA (5-methylaminomethyl-2-thiouridine)(34)-methyltransferase MnmD [Bacteroidales bacterium]|nr:tRNA (5-methylaminomethyl-2-thiouridine)(34)-methyltransferase MnmD [Bacteroidales bacterium]